MASIIKVETLQDTDGNNAVAMQYVASGSAKVWNHYHQIGTPASKDSFNISSIADTTTGLVTHSFTNNMGNANYQWGGGMTNSTGSTPAGDSNKCGVLYIDASNLPTTSTFALYTLYVSNTSGGGGGIDVSIVSFSINGDLA